MAGSATTSSSAGRLALNFERFLLEDAHQLEQLLPATFWRKPLKGDLAEAFGRLTPASGPFTEFARQISLEGLWGFIVERPLPGAIGRYFRWSAPYRAQRLAQLAVRMGEDERNAQRLTVPVGLSRLPNAAEIFRGYVAAVMREMRRQQTTFETWADATGIIGHAVASDVTNHDSLGGWRPHFDSAGVIPSQRAAYRAGGQRALNFLRAADARRKAGRTGDATARADFSVDDPALQARIDQLLLDQVDGIDDTTADDLRRILSTDAMTIGDLAQAISDYWDQASLERAITIAATEMARASAAAELDTYAQNEVEMVEFSGGSSGDICDEYLGEQYPIDSSEAQDLIPVHPNCTHYWAPVIPDDWNLPTIPWAGGDLDA